MKKQTHTTTYKSITAAQAKKLKAKLKDDDSGENWLISITANGWLNYGYYGGSELTFDTKTKSIACESFSE